jgi:hypothetical protein
MPNDDTGMAQVGHVLPPEADKRYYWTLAAKQLKEKDSGVYADFNQIQEENRKRMSPSGCTSQTTKTTSSDVAEELLKNAQDLRQQAEASA